MNAPSTARRLWDLCEPIAGSVYFAPQCRERYRALGLSGRQGYYWSRSAPMGTLSPGAVAAVFAVFNPGVARESTAIAQAACSREQVLAARLAGVAEALRELLPGVDVAAATALLRPVAEAGSLRGRPQYAGRRDLPWPDDAHAALFHAADLVREYRSDAHLALWTGDGLHPVEVQALTEAWWGGNIGVHLRTREWPELVVTEQVDGLRTRGWLDAEGRITDAGLAVRLDLEARTDAAMADMAAVADAVGIDRITDALQPIARRVLEAGLYPIDPARQHGVVAGGV